MMEKNDLIEDCLLNLKGLFKNLAEDFKQYKVECSNLEQIITTLKTLYEESELQEINKYITNDPSSLSFITSELVINLRTLLTHEEKIIRKFSCKILRLMITLDPEKICTLYKYHLIQVIVCKIFEDFKYSSFDERMESFKFILYWLEQYPNNFPIIFSQGVVSIARFNDEYFKKGSIEFIRKLAIALPSQCSQVGGLKILISTLLDGNYLDYSDYIFHTIVFLVNSPNHRIYFKKFTELFRLFSVFTRSEFTVNPKDRDKENIMTNEERNKLDVQLDLSMRIIIKLLKTWPGYFLIFGNHMAMSSIIQSLNTDTCYIVKKAILEMLKEILDLFDLGNIDNFHVVVDNNDFYINKIYFAYIIQGLKSVYLYKTLAEFIEKENNSLTDLAKQIRLKFLLLYSKLSNVDILLPSNNKISIIQSNTSSSNLPMTKKMSSKNSFNNKKEVTENFDDIEMIDNIEMMINKSESFNQFDTFENNLFGSQGNSPQIITEVDEELIQNNIKTMDLLDEKFQNFNQKNTMTNEQIESKDYSDSIILAKDILIFSESSKKYSNEYTVEMAKKELFDLIDDSLFNTIIKASNIHQKDPAEWDWKKIEELLDIVDYKKEMIYELNRQKVFKKLLFFFMPSKSNFSKLTWNPSNFIYCSVGNKVFTLLSSSKDFIKILQTSPEDNIFSVNKSWYEDFVICLEAYAKNYDTQTSDDLFTVKNLNQTLNRQIFVFFGILLHSIHGEDYLSKHKFFNFITSLVISNGRYDHILFLLVDNFNYYKNSCLKFLNYLLEHGSTRIKHYSLVHLKCLISSGKEINWSELTYLSNTNCLDQNLAEILSEILIIVFEHSSYTNDHINFLIPIIDKIMVKTKKKTLMYCLIKNETFMNLFKKTIEEESEKINVSSIIEDYIKNIDVDMNKVFPLEDSQIEYPYLNINLPHTDSQYNQVAEFFWIKQLPFNFHIIVMENFGTNNYKTLLCDCYLEQEENESRLMLVSHIRDEITFNIQKDSLKFICNLGDKIIDQNAKINIQGSIITFDIKDFKDLKKNTVKEKGNNEIKYEKEGFVIEISRICNEEFKLTKAHCYVKINPEKKNVFHPPLNFLTELPNTNLGIEIIIKNNFIKEIIDYINNEKNSLKAKKSAFWILAKMIKQDKTLRLNTEYRILELINNIFLTSLDYGLKGCICYILSYLSTNQEIKNELVKLGWTFFKNRDIAFQKFELMLNSNREPNSKFLQPANKQVITKYINLNNTNEEYFTQIGLLLNTITYKQAYAKLREAFKLDQHTFQDPNLLVKIVYLLSNYRYQQQLRQFIFSIIDYGLSNIVIVNEMTKIIDRLGKDAI